MSDSYDSNPSRGNISTQLSGVRLTDIVMALQQMVRNQSAMLVAIQALGPSNSELIIDSEISTPTAPTTGFIIYVDSADHKLKAIGSSGTVTILAIP